MDQHGSGLASHCPAEPLVMAVRAAKLPLAIASATPEARLLFANQAFARVLGRVPEGLEGAALVSLMKPVAGESSSVLDLAACAVHRVSIDRRGGTSALAALSAAAVLGADKRTMCWLCSLIDDTGSTPEMEAAIEREAEALAGVAQAAGELMAESARAAKATAHAGGDGGAGIASAALERAMDESSGEAA